MDYCHACRRHLNGALACAGCGTPVEELRYETPHIPVQPTYPTQPTQSTYPTPRVDPVEQAEQFEPVPPVGSEHVYELDVVERPRPASGGRRAARGRPAAQGRAATRRGRRARGSRARTVLVGTLGLVLAAGTLSLVRMALEEPEALGAASAVEEQDVPEVTLSPEPVASDLPDGSGPSPVASETSTRPRHVSAAPATGRPVAGSSAGTGSGPGTGSGTGTGMGPGTGSGGEGAPTGSPTATDPASPSATPTATPSATDGDGTPSPSATTGGPTPSTTSPAPTATTPPPTPTPSPNCTRFLWWCV
ncbi:hypothetical protein AB0M38_03710 [Streptomyces sp. NPDC051742]|uniref:SCO2400 family protein n=1 Tax=unclassified Streptomyces TaxID=2593676 RepID=UPI00343F3310